MLAAIIEMSHQLKPCDVITNCDEQQRAENAFLELMNWRSDLMTRQDDVLDDVTSWKPTKVTIKPKTRYFGVK